MDAIDRQAAIATAVRAAIDWHRLANPQYSIAYCIGEAMRALPSVQPERKKGKWIDTGEAIDDDTEVKCSECGEVLYWLSNFCPNCGARMER